MEGRAKKKGRLRGRGGGEGVADFNAGLSIKVAVRN